MKNNEILGQYKFCSEANGGNTVRDLFFFLKKILLFDKKTSNKCLA